MGICRQICGIFPCFPGKIKEAELQKKEKRGHTADTTAATTPGGGRSTLIPARERKHGSTYRLSLKGLSLCDDLLLWRYKKQECGSTFLCVHLSPVHNVAR